MGKRGSILNVVGDWCDDRLRHLCGRITPDARIVIILVMLLLFGLLSAYMVIHTIYHLGEQEGQQLHIEHIESLQLQLQQRQDELDSLKQLNTFYYGTEQQ